jgi:hypothetical protein
LPRRHIKSASGALAAILLLAATLPAGAQDAGLEPLGPIGMKFPALVAREQFFDLGGERLTQIRPVERVSHIGGEEAEL